MEGQKRPRLALRSHKIWTGASRRSCLTWAMSLISSLSAFWRAQGWRACGWDPITSCSPLARTTPLRPQPPTVASQDTHAPSTENSATHAPQLPRGRQQDKVLVGIVLVVVVPSGCGIKRKAKSKALASPPLLSSTIHHPSSINPPSSV